MIASCSLAGKVFNLAIAYGTLRDRTNLATKHRIRVLQAIANLQKIPNVRSDRSCNTLSI
ncbi:hypothetical protein [Nostoc sphaeroides]|uniref:Uncharacterized protein n=1 Tax=Nostoc sphaeroides CCNUC1 TaxID=2653204 RepID=A0A5P8WGN1_9NOSO|nr:hypothetical protein [Nostoc sphaeroides]QFS51770.1 hypothetical protein GXM_09264 [Nostoc sphaeroides CCNUC1]